MFLRVCTIRMMQHKCTITQKIEKPESLELSWLEELMI